ncbi:unnamed protein product [Periconia digitata]|uniref:Peptidase C15, pyroglutamyl peptidase I-like protein n=1 Tax=Periconia digitata TaxID=1303443 RepID=A0A9W4UUN7_9PLEO|nr:unnamed protein product [Periconia digitata]
MSAPETPTKVLVTGFGPFLNIQTNPSAQITSSLPPTLHTPTPIQIITPPSPIPAAYHKIYTQIPALLDQHDPDIVIHMGLAVERDYFAVERSAGRDGYHEFPDIERKVVTRSENRTWFGKNGEDVLVSGVELEGVVEGWRGYCQEIGVTGRGKGKGKGGGKGVGVDVRLSDDVGTYVCGFMYYVGLREMQRRKGRRDVVFLHVPPLEGDAETAVGVRVVEGLIRAIVDAREE